MLLEPKASVIQDMFKNSFKIKLVNKTENDKV